MNSALNTRSRFIRRAVTATAVSIGVALLPAQALFARPPKLNVGLMLPYSGTYASLGNEITDGFELGAAEHGGKLGGREIEYVTLDDESDRQKRRRTRTN